jgi:serine/threonine protein kinase
MLTSSLFSLNICPNLVKIHSLFRADYGIPDGVWRAQTPALDADALSQSVLALPRKQQMDGTQGLYQYIRMEYCAGGDLEELVRQHRLLDVFVVRAVLFQMCFSIYCCRDHLQLRHYDIKLLNFFAADGSGLVDSADRRASQSPKDLRVAFGEHVYRIPMAQGETPLVKLADFGTSAIGSGSLGDPISVQQFTTLENTPIEFLVLGSRARQAFSADTFPLGLAFLHLLAGKDPYEELMSEVTCPPALAVALAQHWMAEDLDDPMHVIREVIDSNDATDRAAAKAAILAGQPAPAASSGRVLYDTLYRYLVLFGVSGSQVSSDSLIGMSDVWQSILSILCAPSDQLQDLGGCPSPQAIYRVDHALWSVKMGSHSIMTNVRDRLHSMGPGAARLLFKMTNFDPAKRCTMHEALTSPAFSCFREPLAIGGGMGMGMGMGMGFGMGCSARPGYAHYFRSPAQAGSDALPIL